MPIDPAAMALPGERLEQVKEEVVCAREPTGRVIHPAVVVQLDRLGQGAQRGGSDRTASKQTALKPRTVEKGFGQGHVPEASSWEHVFDAPTVGEFAWMGSRATSSKTAKTPPPSGGGVFTRC